MHNQKGGSIVLTSASGMCNVSVMSVHELKFSPPRLENAHLTNLTSGMFAKGFLCCFCSCALSSHQPACLQCTFIMTCAKPMSIVVHPVSCMHHCHAGSHIQQQRTQQQVQQAAAYTAAGIKHVECHPLGGAVAHTGVANHDAIAAAKGAVAGLTKGASATYAPHKIRVNCIAPGLVSCSLYISTC